MIGTFCTTNGKLQDSWLSSQRTWSYAPVGAHRIWKNYPSSQIEFTLPSSRISSCELDSLSMRTPRLNDRIFFQNLCTRHTATVARHPKIAVSPNTWSCNCFESHRCKASKVQAWRAERASHNIRDVEILHWHEQSKHAAPTTMPANKTWCVLPYP